MLQNSVTNDLKHRIEIKLTKELTKMKIDYTDNQLQTLVNSVLEVFGDWSDDGVNAAKRALDIANGPYRRKIIRRR